MENKIVQNIGVNEENKALSDEELDKVPGGTIPIRVDEATVCPGSNNVSEETCKNCYRFGMTVDGNMVYCMGVD